MSDVESREALEAEIRGHWSTGDMGAAASAGVRGYGAEILGFLVATLGDPSRGSEAFSIFCEDLVRGLPGFRQTSMFRTWAYTLARNAASRLLRDPFLRRAQPALTDDLAEVAAHVTRSTLPFLRSEVKSAVARLREALDAEERMLLILHIDRQLSLKAVAEVFSAEGEAPVTAAAVRKRYERVKVKLRTMAIREGILPDKG